MATATASPIADECESCALCTSKYNRTRPSFCQCKHCSIPLCFDCMKEHHDELLQDVTQLSHQYNELQQLVHSKRTTILDQTAKCMEGVNRYFETYFDQLRATQNKIIADMEIAKQNAEDHVQKIDAEVRLIGGEVQDLAKENIFQMVKMKKVSSGLKDIEQQLGTYQMIKTENLINTQPEFSIKFDYPSVEMKVTCSTDTKVNEKFQIELQQLPLKSETFKIPNRSLIVQNYPVNQPQTNDLCQHEDDEFSNANNTHDTNSDNNRIDTSFTVDRMASDGENILYTSYNDEAPDIIAYCITNSDNDDADEFRDWKQSRIVDMIWWESIGKFICATDNGIYTVDHINRKFKILDVIHDRWSYIRVAANTQRLFVWMNCIENGFNGIAVFSSKFDFIRAINFNVHIIGSFISCSTNFCVTNSRAASISTHIQKNREVFQVTFYDLNMNKINTIQLGQCSSNIEIRTNGNDRFFITTGRRRLYIVHPNGKKHVINLKNKGSSIAVLDDQRIAISDEGNSMEILTY